MTTENSKPNDEVKIRTIIEERVKAFYRTWLRFLAASIQSFGGYCLNWMRQQIINFVQSPIIKQA